VWFELAVAAAAVLAGTIASVAGFGIGSVLTPLMSTGGRFGLMPSLMLRTVYTAAGDL
jgi:uncharacterized membrane protein YfcA